jgi:hypothetical protein
MGRTEFLIIAVNLPGARSSPQVLHEILSFSQTIKKDFSLPVD